MTDAATGAIRPPGDVIEHCTIHVSDDTVLAYPPGTILRDVTIESDRPVTVRAFTLTGVTFERVQFRNVSFSHGSFDRSTFRHVRFGADLGDHRAVAARCDQVTFRGCVFEWANFKNVTFLTCTFKESTFDFCDFYHARFLEGCVFETATIERSSLWRTDVTGSDLSVTNIAGRNGKGLLIQEQDEDFARYHAGPDKIDDPVQRKQALASAGSEAIDIYTALAGHFASRGQGAQEAWAFVRRKKLEMQLARQRREWLRYLALLVAWLVTGFGESLGRVAATGLVLVLSVSLVFLVGFEQPWYFALAIGLAGLFGSRPESMPHALDSNLLADLTLVTETVAGILLVGLFGFILGNKIRGR